MNLSDLAQNAVHYALSEKATSAEVVISNETGYAVTVRNQAVDTLEHHQEKSFSITVYFGHAQGSASTTDLQRGAMEQSIRKACEIAKFSGADPYHGIVDKAMIAFDYPQLDLYHPWSLPPSQAIDLAIECEDLARHVDKRLVETEEVSVSTYEMQHVFANSHDFVGEYQCTRHGISCSLVASSNHEMQRDYEYTVSRIPKGLRSIEWVAKKAAEKTVSRLGSRKIPTQTCPVVFIAPVAKSLLSAFVNAISGGALYRRASFLLDHLGKTIFPKHVHIYQRPHLAFGMSSAPFDAEGVLTCEQDYVNDGCLVNYVLGSYSARRLNRQTTGNAGGVYNLMIDCDDISFDQLLKEMGRGFLITELMGQGVNIVTGDYSRGAAGFWVENGEIQFPVSEVTIASNLKEMFLNMQIIANDIDTRSGTQTGSILISKMTVAGN